MKKKIFDLLMICLVFIGGINLKAATTDKTAPVIDSFELKTTEAKEGDIVNFSLIAHDDVSGIRDINMFFGSLDNKSFSVLVHEGDTSFVVPQYVVSGDYMLESIAIQDKSDNLMWYINSKVYNGTPSSNQKYIDFGTQKINITSNGNEEYLEPFLKKVTVEKKEIAYQEKQRVTLSITNIDSISKVNVSIQKTDKTLDNIIEECKYDMESSNYICDIKPNSTGEFSLIYVHIMSKKSGGFIYYTDKLEDNDQNKSYLYEGDFKFIVTGDKDSEVPVMNEIKLNKTKVIAPNQVKVYVDAIDEGSGISRGQADFALVRDGVATNKYLTSGTLTYDETTKMLVGTIEIDQYTASGTYYLASLYVSDNEDNCISYTRNKDSHIGCNGVNKIEMLNDTIFLNVIDEFPYDLVTSTTNNYLIKQIKELKDDAVIMIDATNNKLISKEVFEAIKDTDKTIYIEFDGYQWVFKGKDITNPKEIDVYTYTKLLNNENVENSDGTYVEIVFAENGELPGKATIRLKVDYTFSYASGLDNLKLYYFNEEKNEYEYTDAIDFADDGFYEFEITHNSSYVLSSKTPVIMSNKVTNDNKATIKNNDKIFIIIGSSIFVIIVIALIISKSKSKKGIINN